MCLIGTSDGAMEATESEVVKEDKENSFPIDDDHETGEVRKNPAVKEEEEESLGSSEVEGQKKGCFQLW